MRPWFLVIAAPLLLVGCARFAETYQTWSKPGVAREMVDRDYDSCESQAKAHAREAFGGALERTAGFRTPEAIPGASGGASAFAADQREIDRRDYLKRDISSCMSGKGYRRE